MALLQQAGQRRRVAEAAIHQAFVKGFQLVREITNGTDLGHARATLEGVQVALQGRQRQGAVRIGQPAVEGLTGAVEDIDGFLQEDLHHLGVEILRHAGQRHDRLRRGRCNRFRFRLRLDGRYRLRLGRQLLQLHDFQTANAVGVEQRQGGGVERLVQQVAQGRHALGLRADLQGGGNLVHLADQRFVGGLGLAEEVLADGQAAIQHRLIEGQQGLTQFADLRQFGHLGATAEHGQFLQQRGQLLLLAGVLTPLAQQVFGVQQDVHAFGEEDRDQLRIAMVLLFQTRTLGAVQAAVMQFLHPLEELRSAGNRRQRLALQLLEACTEQLLGIAQQLSLGQVHGDQIGLEFLDQLLQRCGDLGDRQDAGHVRAALEGMQGTLQVIGHRLRQFLGAIGKEADQGIQVGFGLVAEDFQQQGVKAVVLDDSSRRDRRYRLELDLQGRFVVLLRGRLSHRLAL